MKCVLIWFVALMATVVFPANAATITVTTNADSGAGSLREAINTANMTLGPHTIDFDADYTITLASSLPTIDSGAEITIVGNGWNRTIIDGGDRWPFTRGVRAFVVVGSLILDGVTIRYCYYDVQGGAIVVGDVGSLQFLNSRAEFNRSGIFGGVIYAAGAVIVQNSVIANNRSNDGAGIFIDGGTTTVEDSTVVSNLASNSGGGSIASRYSANLTVRRSLFQDNDVTSGDGGGIKVKSGGQTLIENSTFVEHGARYGGAIYCGNICDLTIRGSTITTNRATSGGGGIYEDGGSIDLEGSIVYGNWAPSGPVGYEGPDIYGLVNSLGYNVIGDTARATISGDTTGNLLGVDPQLGAIASNGGTTNTCALGEGSPAIDAGPPACGGLSTDQRGYPRPVDGDLSGTSECDIGAYEYDEDDSTIFADDFESGGTAEWSSVIP